MRVMEMAVPLQTARLPRVTKGHQRTTTTWHIVKAKVQTRQKLTIATLYIQHTNRPCPCDNCLQGKPKECSVTRLFKNTVGTKRLERAKGLSLRQNTRSRVTKTFTDSICEGTIVVVRVHDDDENPLDEPYFLGVVCRDQNADVAAVDETMLAEVDEAAEPEDVQQLCWRNNKTQDVGSGNLVNKNVMLIRFRWLHYRPDSGGDKRSYEFQPGEDTVVFPVYGIVTKTKSHEAAQTLKLDGSTRWLECGAHEEIMKDSIDLLP
jgi:hypothetical protein